MQCVWQTKALTANTNSHPGKGMISVSKETRTPEHGVSGKQSMSCLSLAKLRLSVVRMAIVMRCKHTHT